MTLVELLITALTVVTALVGAAIAMGAVLF